MKIPKIHGFIDRRILINYSADADVVEKILPNAFKPKLYNGKAMVGICLIRLKHIKPKGFPDFLGVNSENAAHRIAVEWDENGVLKSGVYIPRRDTSLRLNSWVGGRIFPGKHNYAKFNVEEKDQFLHIDFKSSDETEIDIDAEETENFPEESLFKSLKDASQFYEEGELGYSPHKEKFEGLRLKAYNWKVTPLKVTNVKSSFFSDETLFPKGSVKFDNALLMRNIEHEWIAENSI